MRKRWMKPLEAWRPAKIKTPVENCKGAIIFQPGDEVKVRLSEYSYMVGQTLLEVFDAKDEENPFLISGKSVVS